MTPSTRTPSRRQTQALAAIASGRGAELDHVSTEGVHGWREAMSQHAGRGIVEKQRETYMLLVTCHRYEWVERTTVDEAAHRASPNDGAGIRWTLTEPGRQALQRGHAALASTNTKENDVDTTTQDPPAAGAPPWDGATEPSQQGDDPAALAELDGEDADEQSAGEVEVEEPKETRHTVEGQQLQFTLTIGGAKPSSSILSINAKQIAFVDREFRKGDVIPFHGEIHVTEVGARDKKKGTERFHRAVIDTVAIGVDG